MAMTMDFCMNVGANALSKLRKKFMKTQEDLYLEYAQVITMVREYNKKNGTDVKPWECVKLWNIPLEDNPIFEYKPDEYTFAIAILEGKPVFVGDKLYGKISEDFHDITESSIERNRWNVGNADAWSWTQPQKKRTFMLNGVELPCPKYYPDDKYSAGVLLNFCGIDYEFESIQDRNAVAKAINNTLEQARDKE